MEAGLIACTKEGLYVKYRLGDGLSNRYAASMLGNLRHWLEEDPEVSDIAARLPGKPEG